MRVKNELAHRFVVQMDTHRMGMVVHAKNKSVAVCAEDGGGGDVVGILAAPENALCTGIILWNYATAQKNLSNRF